MARPIGKKHIAKIRARRAKKEKRRLEKEHKDNGEVVGYIRYEGDGIHPIKRKTVRRMIFKSINGIIVDNMGMYDVQLHSRTSGTIEGDRQVNKKGNKWLYEVSK